MQGKLLGVPVRKLGGAECQHLGNVPTYPLTEIEHFEVYKELEGRHIHAVRWEGALQAQEVLENAITP